MVSDVEREDTGGKWERQGWVERDIRFSKKSDVCGLSEPLAVVLEPAGDLVAVIFVGTAVLPQKRFFQVDQIRSGFRPCLLPACTPAAWQTSKS